MKKTKFILPVLVLLAGCCLFKPSATIEVGASETVQTTEVNEEQLVEKGEEIIETAKNWISENINTQLIFNIVNWGIDLVIAIVAVCVYIKHIKYKALTTVEISNNVEKVIEAKIAEKLNEYNETSIKRIEAKLDEQKESNDRMCKAFILSQDKSTEGKLAVLDIISTTTKKEEDVKVINEIKEKINTEEKIKQKINDEVKSEYKKIF